MHFIRGPFSTLRFSESLRETSFWTRIRSSGGPKHDGLRQSEFSSVAPGLPAHRRKETRPKTVNHVREFLRRLFRFIFKIKKPAWPPPDGLYFLDSSRLLSGGRASHGRNIHDHNNRGSNRPNNTGEQIQIRRRRSARDNRPAEHRLLRALIGKPPSSEPARRREPEAALDRFANNQPKARGPGRGLKPPPGRFGNRWSADNNTPERARNIPADGRWIRR